MKTFRQVTETNEYTKSWREIEKYRPIAAAEHYSFRASCSTPENKYGTHGPFQKQSFHRFESVDQQRMADIQRPSHIQELP